MFKGLGGLGDMAGMMKKAQEMQGKMAQLQDDMHNINLQRRRQRSRRRSDPCRDQGRPDQSQ